MKEGAFKKCFKQWYMHWEKCMNFQGHYFKEIEKPYKMCLNAER